MTRLVDPLRRGLLKGLVGTGVAGYASTAAVSGLADVDNGDAWRYVLIVTDSVAAASFRRGVEARLPSRQLKVMHSRLDPRLLNALTHEMRRPGRRLLGFVDDAFGVLLIDAARGSGARLRWQAEYALPSHGVASWARTLGGQLTKLDPKGRIEVPPGHPAGEAPGRHVLAFVIESPKEHTHGRS